MAILIDSSVWITAQNSKNPECLALKRLIAHDELIYTTRLIQVEVCQGAKSEDIFHQLWDSFLGFEMLTVEDSLWGQTAWNYFKCRKKGYTVTTIDCLIATLGHEYAVPIWTMDKHFKKIQPILGFELFETPC